MNANLHWTVWVSQCFLEEGRNWSFSETRHWSFLKGKPRIIPFALLDFMPSRDECVCSIVYITFSLRAHSRIWNVWALIEKLYCNNAIRDSAWSNYLNGLEGPTQKNIIELLFIPWMKRIIFWYVKLFLRHQSFK